ncbi:glycoside hydrolase domain-containing protein [Phytohabitans sp. LJ34]|uniref:glycoside hydrolase domain-containing protein n=1 Tax=Phytohabitans sp. LJ34 TaxID=3452217 RepID=UPI003F89C2BE
MPPRARRPAGPRRDTVPAAFVGVDRISLPIVGTGRRRTFSVAWMEWLYDHSNIRWTAAYLFGDRDRGWISNARDVQRIGYGILPIWMPASKGHVHDGHARVGANDAATEANARADALEAKQAAVAAGMPAGAVIYIDSEDQNNPRGAALSAPAIRYFTTWLDAMSAPGPGPLPVFRAGLYSRDQPVAEVLAERPFVFSWPIDRQLQVSHVAPFTQTASAISVQHPSVAAVAIAPGGLAWPVARQNYYYRNNTPRRRSEPNAEIPAPASPAPAGAPGGAQREWDFSSSLVRDPSFPAGEPRLAAAVVNNRPLLVTLTPVEPQPGRTPRQRTGAVRIHWPARTARPIDVPVDAATPVDPERTVVAASGIAGTVHFAMVGIRGGGGPPRTVLTGQIAAAGVVAPAPLPGTVPEPRRLDGMAIATAGNTANLVYIDRDNRIVYAHHDTRRWLVETPRLPSAHPLSRLAVTTDGTTVTWVYIGPGNALTVCDRQAAPVLAATVTATVALPPGTGPANSLAAVTAGVGRSLVLVTGPDRRLWAATKLRGQWSPLQPLQGDNQPSTVDAHAPLAAVATGAGTPVVVALGTDGLVHRYDLSPAAGSATEWTATRADALGGTTGPAVNPFGDLQVIQPAGQPALLAADILTAQGSRGQLVALDSGVFLLGEPTR